MMPTPEVLRPSSAYRWRWCGASWRMEALFPDDEESVEAREGTAAHHYATEGAKGVPVAVGSLAPNGHPIDEAMTEGGALFINAFAGRAAMASPSAVIGVEQMVAAPRLIHPTNKGTPDAFIFDRPLRRIDIFDYKYGFAFVDEYENEQLVDYLACVLDTHDVHPDAIADWTVSFHIVQPRYFAAQPVRSWTTTGLHAAALIDQMRAAAELATSVNPPAVSGGHCRYCKALTACEAGRRTIGAAMEFSTHGVPAHLSPEAVGVYYSLITTAQKRLEAMRVGLEELGLSMTRAGTRVPGWTRGYADTREVWDAPVAEVTALGDLFGVDLRKKPDVITPAQAKTAFKKASVDASVIASYSRKPPGAAKLIPADDTHAPRVFGPGPISLPGENT